MKKESQSGNVFFIILLGIALFAALSYAISQGMRSGGANITEEKAHLAVAELQMYANDVRDTIKRMHIDGIPFELLSFETDTITDSDGTPRADGTNTACTVNSCKVFHRDGGGLSAKQFYHIGTPDSGWDSTWTRPGGVTFTLGNVEGLGTNRQELLLTVYQVNKDFCLAVNEANNITDTDPHADTEVWGLGWGTMQSVLDTTPAGNFGIGHPELRGKLAFCTPGDRIVYMVIQIR